MKIPIISRWAYLRRLNGAQLACWGEAYQENIWRDILTSLRKMREILERPRKVAQ